MKGLSPIEQPVSCVTCGAQLSEEDALFDERNEHWFCDKMCFYEWADDNFETVADYYFATNIG